MTDCRIGGVVSTSKVLHNCFENPWFSKGRRDDPPKRKRKKSIPSIHFSGANLLLVSGSVKKESENYGLEDYFSSSK